MQAHNEAQGAEGLEEPVGGNFILRVEGLKRSFGGVWAVSDVSMEIQSGRLTGLIGPNGAGKSTMLAMLAGTTDPTSGCITFAGQDVTHLRAFQRANLGLVRTFQLSSEFKRLTVLENLLVAVPDDPGDSFTGSLFRRSRWRSYETASLAEAARLLRDFRLEAHADAYAGDLSGGQRRLVEIMRALMTRPKLLLLDEPMAGVHPKLAIEIGDQLLRLVHGGMSILMVEHELSIVDRLCEPVIVMAEGRVLAQGTMAELRGQQEVVDAYLVG